MLVCWRWININSPACCLDPRVGQEAGSISNVLSAARNSVRFCNGRRQYTVNPHSITAQCTLPKQLEWNRNNVLSRKDLHKVKERGYGNYTVKIEIILNIHQQSLRKSIYRKIKKKYNRKNLPRNKDEKNRRDIEQGTKTSWCLTMEIRRINQKIR